MGAALRAVNPNGPTEPNEHGVVRDLNNAWSPKCIEWVTIGIDVLDDAHIAADHRAGRDAVGDFMSPRRSDPSLGGNLVLDTLTLHDPELNRIAARSRKRCEPGTCLGVVGVKGHE